MKLLRRIVMPPFFALLTLLAMLVAHTYFPLQTLFEWPIMIVGLVPICTGLGLMISAVGLFSKANTTVIPFEESTKLVTTGPYKLTRNPMYVGYTLLLIGSAILFGTFTPLLLWPFFVLIIDLGFIRAEERMLTTKFGDSYADYRQKVRRWL
jgi:protein-S-isoprenylcysteine O-methyltransferase Ste14